MLVTGAPVGKVLTINHTCWSLATDDLSKVSASGDITSEPGILAKVNPCPNSYQLTRIFLDILLAITIGVGVRR